MNLLLRIFQFRGTATSMQAMASVLLYSLVVGILFFAPIEDRYLFPGLGLASVLMLTTSARRLHHAGRTGRWAALTLVPIFGVLAALVIAFLPQRRVQLNAHFGARVAGYAVIALILLLSLCRVWWAPFLITTDSMKPTLLVGDLVIAALDLTVDAGEAIVLRAHGETVVQRVIGLPGDQVALTAGQVMVNGAPLLQFPDGRFDEVMGPHGPNAIRPRCENGVVGEGAICSATKLREVWPSGRAYQVLNIETGRADDFAQVTVPADTLFVLGDNRDTAIDSRYDARVKGLGFVPFADVVGPVRRVLLSSSGSSPLQIWNWRWGRVMGAVD
jgi:signal peptidase I